LLVLGTGTGTALALGMGLGAFSKHGFGTQRAIGGWWNFDHKMEFWPQNAPQTS
jgi:hypothetical protein